LADAGPDQTVDEGTDVTLSGIASTDNVGIASYKWSFEYDGSYIFLEGAEVQFLFTVPGEYDVTLNVTDLSGKWDTDQVTVRVLDRTPPGIIVYSPVEDELTRNATYVVSGKTEPLTRVDIQVESSGGTRDYTLTSREDGTFEFSIELFEGIQNVIITAIDATGNPSTSHITVILDTVAPEFVINNPAQTALLTREDRIDIICTIRFPAQNVTLIIGDLEIPNAEGIIRGTVDLQEGENVIEVKAVDMAGNEMVKVLTVTRDSTPPTLKVSVPPGDTLYTNVTSVHFEGTVVGAVGVVVQHRSIEHGAGLRAGSWEDGEWEYDLELGPHDLEQVVFVKAHDLAGNEVMVSVYVVLDLVPPSLFIDREDLEYTNQTEVTISGSTDVSIGVVLINGVEVTVDGGIFSTVVDLDEGLNTFVIRVEDEAGNAAVDTVVFTRDTQAPTFDLDYPKRTDKERVVISGTCDKDVVRVWANLESFDVENGTLKIKVALPKDGMNLISVTFEDMAGNSASELIQIKRTEGTPGFGAWWALLAFVTAIVVFGRRRIGI
jgi:hypothetical protein